mmetsp:Transcript_13562/g.13764  ORF Transcript_13562/g.13764 Transcript_13562/m.13764 type:complete len:322 (-) Transcript_13562:44-1009(-)
MNQVDEIGYTYLSNVAFLNGYDAGGVGVAVQGGYDVANELSMMILYSMVFSVFCHRAVRFLIKFGLGGSKQTMDVDVLGKGSRKNSDRDLVVICGARGAGKTVLFHALLGTPCSTVTSMKAAEGMLGDIRMLDFPGHVRLRSSLRTLAETCSRLVVVMDSSNPTSTSENANILFLLLTTKFVTSKANNKMEVLVVCSKSDSRLSKNTNRIKIQLRVELERMKKTKLNALSKAGGNKTKGSGTMMDDGDLQSEMDEVAMVGDSKPLNLDTCEGLNCRLTFVSVGGLVTAKMKQMEQKGPTPTSNDGLDLVRTFVLGKPLPSK